MYVHVRLYVVLRLGKRTSHKVVILIMKDDFWQGFFFFTCDDIGAAIILEIVVGFVRMINFQSEKSTFIHHQVHYAFRLYCRRLLE